MNRSLTTRSILATVAFGALVVAATGRATGQGADADYIAKVSAAAPDAVSKNATILAMATDGSMRTVRKGTNDFTCMLMPDGTPMCADKNGMEWLHAKIMNTAPPDRIGFMYMLAGDAGASNTDPSAKGPTPDNHWTKTGPHVMILGPSAAKTLGYARTADVDSSQPSVMWAGTPYEHVMIPVK